MLGKNLPQVSGGGASDEMAGQHTAKALHINNKPPWFFSAFQVERVNLDDQKVVLQVSQRAEFKSYMMFCRLLN